MKKDTLKKSILSIFLVTFLLCMSISSSVVGISESLQTQTTVKNETPAYWTYERPLDTSEYKPFDYPQPIAYETPPQFDLRNVEGNNYVTSIKSQSGGTCWVHAILACMESNLIINDIWSQSGYSGEPNLAEYHMDWWNGFNDYYNADVLGSQGLPIHNGAQSRIAAAYLSRGAAVYSEYANDASEQDLPWYTIPPEEYNSNYDYFYVNDIEVYDIGENLEQMDLIKSKIMEHGPITIVFRADTDYLTGDFIHYQPPSSDELPNHNVAIIGWDDNLETPAEADGAWLCKNSWGTGWGLNGYFWMSYYDKYCCHVFDGYEWTASFQNVEPMPYSRVYYHDYHGWQDDFTLSNEAFNAFIAQGNEALCAVSFFTCTENVDFEVKIYDSYENGELGDELWSQTGAVDFRGFHTEILENPVALHEEDDFYIYVQLSDGGHAFDCSSDIWGYYVESIAHPGESYYLDSSGQWLDLTSFDSTANFCIKGLVVPSADLSCDTNSLNFGELSPGETATASFSLENVGEQSSTDLSWSISSYPDWGTWTFSQEEGQMAWDDSPVEITIEVEAPEDKNTEFDGEILVVNTFDPQDRVNIQISLATPRNTANGFFQRFLSNHPLLSDFLDYLLNLDCFI